MRSHGVMLALSIVIMMHSQANQSPHRAYSVGTFARRTSATRFTSSNGSVALWMLPCGSTIIEMPL